jgi:hypothetical protein
MHTAAFCAELLIGTLLPEPTTPVSHNEVSMRIVRFGAGLAALVLSAHVWAAQQPTAPPQPDRRPGGMTGASGMAAQMQMMDSLDARFDTLVSRMNRATGNSKVTAMAAVINELVAQRKGDAGTHAPDDGVPGRDDAHDAGASGRAAPRADA